MDTFDWKSLQERRKMYRVTGWLALAVGVFLLADSIFREPIPLNVRQSFPVSIMLIVGGLTMLYFGYRLPVLEAREYIFGRSEDGHSVSATELCREMRISIHTAEEVIQALLDKGFIQERQHTDPNHPKDEDRAPEYEAVQ